MFEEPRLVVGRVLAEESLDLGAEEEESLISPLRCDRSDSLSLRTSVFNLERTSSA